MPFHRFYVPQGLYCSCDKRSIAEAVTEVYVKAGLPRFYVVVNFIEVSEENFYVSGKRERKRDFMQRYEKAIEPFTKGRGIRWEIQITEMDRDLWNENGMNPPLGGSDGELLWRKLDRAIPYTAEHPELR
ncbi:putative oxalocrotonate tautomerase enzyme-domain-containing protein [Desarmillaria tabescens]|uniref:Oxalocrotonate tautomerase enzyme-domain-containing protein n=1 Tax=Armillaria tabescens TaxID=1929756 RepID=A0AA39JXF4_ARMTA|nr:putative oxalocrotonate tautomerase enzyme-domain-containing protein [Desarmillaria tabescens]KAK0450518.1 putative oxalocrotonate tautomerase enzyme-domain-containing protein [Desarmillaria tabescens]